MLVYQCPCVHMNFLKQSTFSSLLSEENRKTNTKKIGNTRNIDNLQNLRALNIDLQNGNMRKMYCENLYSSFDDFKYIIGENSGAIWKTTNLAKFATLIQTEFFQALSKFCTYFWHSHKIIRKILKIQLLVWNGKLVWNLL